MDFLFSIIIPTYNRAALLNKTLQSFATQEYKYFEVIVVDDGGNDNTAKVVEALNDPRFKYYWKINAERGAARNYGAALAKGEYLNFFDSDDIAHPNHLSEAVLYIKKHNLPDCFHFGYDIKQPDGKLLHLYNNFKEDLLEKVIYQKFVSTMPAFFSCSVLKQVKFSEERMLSVSEDAVFLRQVCARFSLGFKNVVTVTMIEHSSRSMNTSTFEKMLARKTLSLKILGSDNIFMEKFGKHLLQIEAEYDYLLSILAFERGNTQYGITYSWKFLKNNSRAIYSRYIILLKKVVLSITK